MKHFWKIFLIILLIILIILLFPKEVNIDDTSSDMANEDYREVCFPDVCIDAEIADSLPKIRTGLMHRESLDEDKGMIFIFEKEEIYPFWMKNTLIPLDMIWVNFDKEIVYIEHAVPCEADPCISYNPDVAALYVIEVNAGFTEKYGIELGDIIEIS